MKNPEDIYVLKQRANHYGMFFGLTIAVLALVTVFSLQIMFWQNDNQPTSSSQTIQLITDATPFVALVSQHQVSAEQQTLDQVYYDRLLTTSNPLAPSPAFEGLVINGEVTEFEPVMEDETSSSYKYNPYLISILGYNFESFENSIVGDDFYQSALEIHDALLALAALAHDSQHLPAVERIESDLPFQLPYPNALQTTLPSSHVLLLFLLRDLALLYEEEFFRPADPEEKLVTADQELRAAIDEGIRLRLYTLSDAMLAEEFYHEFIRTLRQNNTISPSWPVQSNLLGGSITL
jgi:hypothetical protein